MRPPGPAHGGEWVWCVFVCTRKEGIRGGVVRPVPCTHMGTGRIGVVSFGCAGGICPHNTLHHPNFTKHHQEVPVNWQEVAGSKLIQRKIDVVLASLGIFRDMLCVRLCYLLGLWSSRPFTRQGLWGGKKGEEMGAEAVLRRSPRRAGGRKAE